MADDRGLHISAEIGYWAISTMECWSCKRETRVTALVAAPPVYIREGEEAVEEDGALFVTGVPELSEASMQELRSINAQVWLDESRTAGSSYLMNHCRHCDAKIGDHYVTQIHGPLLPLADEDIGKIQLASMKEPVDLECGGYSQSSRLDEVLRWEPPYERGY